MNYYQESYNYHHGNNYSQNDEINIFNQRSMLGDINEPNTNMSNDDYDPDYDLEVNKLLQEVEEDFLLNGEENETEKSEEVLDENTLESEKDQFEDYYDEFPEDNNETNDIPEWYEAMIQKKVKETKLRLEDLSTLVCYASASTREQIIRIEQDHNTPFCKLDYPRHPSFSKPWINYWRFNCVIKCKEDPPEPGHAHTSECESLVLEHVNSGVTTKSKNIFPNEFPRYVMHTVELFQQFAIESSKVSYSDTDEIPDTVYEKPMWTYIKLRSNYKNELMLIACGKGVSILLKPLKRFFRHGPGRSCNVVSVYCINIKWSQKKGQFHPAFLYGCLELRDKVGPISINYNPKTNINFNSIEALQLGKIMLEYLAPTTETTIIEIGCNFGVLSLMLSQKSDKVIGLNTLDHEIKMAEEVKRFNGIHNASFLVCHPKEIHTKCSSLVKKCISVAVLNLSTTFGKSHDVMKALRNLPSIWRVAVYGTFTKEFHKPISVLTSKDDQLGDEFLPMQGCILDKSPSKPTGFDIVILFERKSLIEPSIELIAAGPTVNVKDEDNPRKIHSASLKLESDSTVKIEKGYDKDRYIKNPAHKPGGKNPFSTKFNRPPKIFSRFDSPSVLIEKDSASKNPVNENKLSIQPLPKYIEMDFESPPVSIPKDKKFDRPSFPVKDNSYNSSLAATKLKIKDLKKMFDCQSLPKPKEKQFDCPPPPIPNDKQLNYPPLPNSNGNDKQFDNTLLSKSDDKQFDFSKPPPSKFTEKQFDYPPPPLPKSTEEQLDCPSPPKFIEKQYDCPSIPAPTENQFDITLQLKTNQSFMDCIAVKQEQKSNFSPPLKSNENSIDSSSTKVKKEVQFGKPPLPVKEEKNYSPLPNSNIKAKSFICEKEDGELSPDSVDSDLNSVPNITIKSEPMDETDIDNALRKCEAISTDSDSTQPTSNIRIKTEPIDYMDVPIKTEPVTTCIKAEPDDKISPISDLDTFENMVTPVHNPIAYDKCNTPSPPAISANFTTIDGFEFSVKPNQTFLSYKPDSDGDLQKIPLPQQPSSAKKQDKNNKVGLIKLKPEVLLKKENMEDDDISIISVKKEKDQIKKERRISQETRRESRKNIKEENVLDEQDNIDRDRDLRDLIEKRKIIQKQLENEREYRKLKSYDRSPSPVTKRYRSPISPSESRYRSPSSMRYRSPSPSRSKIKRYRSPLSPVNRYFNPSPPSSMYRRSPSYSRYRRSPLSPTSRRMRYRRRSISRSRSRSPSEKRRARSPSFRKRRTKSRSRSRSRSPKKYRYTGMAYSQFSNSSQKKKDKRSSSSVKESITDKGDDQWDIPGLSTLKKCRQEEKRKVKNNESMSPAISTSSTSSSASAVTKHEIS